MKYVFCKRKLNFQLIDCCLTSSGKYFYVYSRFTVLKQFIHCTILLTSKICQVRLYYITNPCKHVPVKCQNKC